MWIDRLDVPLVGMGKMLGEGYSQDQQPRTSPVGFSGKTLGHVKPTFIKSEHPTPPFRYAWEDTLDTLEALKESEVEGDPANGLLLTYTHPLTGGPTLPTFACELQLAGERRQRGATGERVRVREQEAIRGVALDLALLQRLERLERVLPGVAERRRRVLALDERGFHMPEGLAGKTHGARARLLVLRVALTEHLAHADQAHVEPVD